MGKKIYIETYGCTANKGDTEIMMGILGKSGFSVTESLGESDLVIVNTCIVKTPTEQRMRRRIQDLTKMGKPMVIAGCMTKTSQKDIEKFNREASLIGPDSLSKITECVTRTLKGERVLFLDDENADKTSFPRSRIREKIGIVTIASGCMGNCSYCITKHARGKLRSYPVGNIRKQIEDMVEDGIEEIHLTSEDNGCYGLDIGTDLSSLLNEISSIGGKFKIKVGMMNPAHIKSNGTLERLIESFKKDKIKKFIHIPIQSGSDAVLKNMKRGYTSEDVMHIVRKFREGIPGIYISTDVIVGFPTESEEDFQKTVDLLNELKFNNVNISRFGLRPGTEAEKMEQLDSETIINRSRELYGIISS